MAKKNLGRIKAKKHGRGRGEEISKATGEAVKLKRKMQKALALVDYYNNLGSRKISNEEELKEIRSKIVFTQKQILRLCLESKKIIKDVESKT